MSEKKDLFQSDGNGNYICCICGKSMPDYEPVYCCSGKECGCYGMPQEPPICSKECWDKMD